MLLPFVELLVRHSVLWCRCLIGKVLQPTPGSWEITGRGVPGDARVFRVVTETTSTTAREVLAVVPKLGSRFPRDPRLTCYSRSATPYARGSRMWNVTVNYS